MVGATGQVPINGRAWRATAGPPPGPPPNGSVDALHWTVIELDRSTVVSFAGEVDRSNSHLVASALQATPMQAAPPWGTPGLICDLADVTFIDAGGVQALLAARSAAALWRVRTDLVCPGGIVRKLLAITGADQVLPVHTALRPALRAQARAFSDSNSAP